MQTPSPSAVIPPVRPQTSRGRSPEDLVYQVMTVGAILLVIGSLWVF